MANTKPYDQALKYLAEQDPDGLYSEGVVGCGLRAAR